MVVGTLQSESQGLGRQEWIITTIDLSIGTPRLSRTYASSDFNFTGSFVKNRHASSQNRKLLLTRWIQRTTAHGERLILLGNLVGIGAPPIEQSTLPDLQRRFDRNSNACV